MLTAMTAASRLRRLRGHRARDRSPLRGRKGTFALQHTGIMNRADAVAHDHRRTRLGHGPARGLAGTMAIIIAADGKHSYEFDYTLAEAP